MKYKNKSICSKTISGNHKWIGGFWTEEYETWGGVPIRFKELKPTIIPRRWEERKCYYCGIIDDTYEK